MRLQTEKCSLDRGATLQRSIEMHCGFAKDSKRARERERERDIAANQYLEHVLEND